MKDTNEIWKDIKDFEEIYQVSSAGRIKSLERIVKDYMHKNGMHRKERILAQGTNKFGYKKVCLSKDNKKYHKQVHRLVAEAFIPNPNNFPIINHKDENKTNNNVSNLEWCTYQYNHAYNNLHLRIAAKTKKTNTELYGKKVVIAETGEVFESIRELCRTKNINRKNVSKKIKRVKKSDNLFMLKLTPQRKHISVACVETGRVFYYLQDAAKWVKRNCSTLETAIKNPNRTCGGYHWKLHKGD